LFKRIIISVLIICAVLASSISVSAASSETYTRVDVPGSTTEIRLSREMYSATCELTSASFGISEAFDGITDIYCNKSGDTYLLCGDESRIWHFNKDYTSCNEIKIKNKKGNEENFKGAKGIFCDTDNLLYIADTDNKRIIITDLNGVVKKILDAPVSDLIPDDFLYQPSSVAKDGQGYLYVLSVGCYYGALIYSPDYEFMGFYGSNTVESSALDTLSFLWQKLTSNDAKKSASVKKLPYSFADLCFDPEDFMVTCTGSLSSSVYGNQNVGQIKKISPSGDNILMKRNLKGDFESSSGVDFLEKEHAEGAGVQEIVSVAVSEDNYIFALDRGNGYIYVYDSQCNLLSAFGGGFAQGKRLGIFKNPVALTFNDNSVIVADSDKKSITIFGTTEYGTLIRKAENLFISGDYLEAKELWQKVLTQNRNCQLAYRGLSMAYYSEGKYREALDAAKTALDYSVYDLAWQEIVTQSIADHFVLIIVLLSLIIVGIILLIVYLRRKNIKLIKNEKFKLYSRVIFHPFDSFEQLKYKKLGSYKIAITITVLFYIASVLNVIASGFLYSNTLLRNYNALFTLASSVGLLLLWSVCNWLVCSMFNGKGTFKDVYVSTCYAITPWVIFLFVKVILSNFLPLSSSSIVSGFQNAVLILTFFLLCVAMIKVHEYDFFKIILTSVVVLLMMILVLFVILMCAILIVQFGSFIVSIYEEVVHR